MPDALKNMYDSKFVHQLAETIQRHHSSLDKETLQTLVLDKNWEARELKSRMQHISRSIHLCLDMSYLDALEIIKLTAPSFSGGFEGMIFPDYVEQFGQGHWEHSIKALEELTIYSSAEFAVRPFIIKAPDEMMKQMLEWSEHPDQHVRRLASEGCRPRLPWAMALPQFKDDPSLILPILKNLKQDSSDYVRRSVANNLNDIAKDNPDITIKTAKAWQGQHPNTDKLVKHGLRTLLKRGNKDALKLIGTHRSEHIKRANLILENSQLTIGDTLLLHADISGGAEELGQLRIEYHIDFVKKSGAHSRKTFKLAEGNYTTKDRQFSKKHSLRQMSTRTHYPGIHNVTLVINGEKKSEVKFNLTESNI